MKLKKVSSLVVTALMAAFVALSAVGCKGDGLVDEGDGVTAIAIDLSSTVKTNGKDDWNKSAMGFWGWGGNWNDDALHAMGLAAWGNTALKKYGTTDIYYFKFPDDAVLPEGATVCFHDDMAEDQDRYTVVVTLKKGQKKIVKAGSLVDWKVDGAGL